MCKACKMDPKEVARLYERQGAVEVDDFDKEVNYQTRMTGRGAAWGGSRKKIKNKRGCPGNNFKAHIYVWTTETEEDSLFSDYFGFHKRQSKVCAGCGKKNGSALSEEYLKVKERKWAKLATPEKGIPVSRWRWRRKPYVTFTYWNWEYQDEGFLKAREKYLVQRGYTSYFYGF